MITKIKQKYTEYVKFKEHEDFFKRGRKGQLNSFRK